MQLCMLLLLVAVGHSWATEAAALPASLLNSAEFTATGSRPARAAALLPPGRQPLRLFPNDFDDSLKVCTDAEVLSASFPSFALPTDGPQLSLLLHLTSLGCPSGRQPGVLLSLGGNGGSSSSASSGGASPALEIAYDCARQQLLLTSTGRGSLIYQLPAAASSSSSDSGLTLLLTLDSSTPPSFGACANGQPLRALLGGSAAVCQLLEGASSGTDLLGPAVVFGAAPDWARTARADVAAAYVADAAIPCNRTLPGPDLRALLEQLSAAAQTGAAAAMAQPPAVAVEQQPAAAVAVGVMLQLAVTTTPGSGAEGLAHRMRLTFYGLAPEGCSAAECGDRVVDAPLAPPGAPARLAVSAAYPRAGRYVVRVEVSSMQGLISTHDHVVLVRKQGDPALLSADGTGGAPCCHHSPSVVAQQLGRPISDSQYRSTTAIRQAATLGWSEEYMQYEDVEAERLPDYGMLAPSPQPLPIALATCLDTRLAGAGSPVLYGALPGAAAGSRGHNKRLAIVPAGYDWVTSTDQITCQKHWSGWQQGSPHTLPDGDGVCSTVCTRDGTLQLMHETGMFDQYNQALVAASYGALSIGADVAVLPETYIPYRPADPATDNFTYYEDLPRQALTASGIDPWMFLVLVPLAQHRVPVFHAWTGGGVSGGAVITQCFPSFYYAVHETGHRMGFRHANLLDGGVTAPSDPLGPGETTINGYSDSLDMMACCRGNYGLYYRATAGWLRGGATERSVITLSELRVPGQRRLTLWPFDRPESRGNLMLLSLWRSDNEVLLVGFRSSPHWQDVGISGSGDLAPQDSRYNVRGLVVEVVKRDPATGAWADHRGTLDFNTLKGDWPDALPAGKGEFARSGAFTALKEGTAWHDPASGLLLSFERVGGCSGVPGLPLYNHSAPAFYGFRGEWPFHEAYEQADYTGFQGLECAQLVVSTAAPPPQGRLEFGVETAPAASTPGGSRRRLAMQPTGTGSGQLAAGGGAGACGVPSVPVLRLRLPAGQQLSSVIWKDSLNRTVSMEGGASLAAASSAPGGDGAGWTTAAVALPPLYPLQESSSDKAQTCSTGSAACQELQRRYSVLVLAADGRHARADISMVHASLAGQRVAVRYKHYETSQLSYQQDSLEVPLSWPPVGSTSDAPAGIALYDSSAPGSRALELQQSGSAVVAGSGLPSSSCSQQWSLTLQLSLSPAAVAAAAQAQEGHLLLLVDGGFPALTLGPSQLPASSAAPAALWLHWGARRRRLALPRSFGRQGREQAVHVALVRDGGRLGLWADQQGGWLIRDLSCIPSRPSINYCDPAAAVDTATRASAAFRSPGEIRLGAAAASQAGAAAADASLVWARYYTYAVPEGDLAAEAAAEKPDLLQYFRLLPEDGGSGGRSGEVRVVLVSPPEQKGGGGGLPIAMLGAAAGGGAVLLAAAIGGCWWCRRRRRRLQQGRMAALDAVSSSSASSIKSAGAALLAGEAGPAHTAANLTAL